MGGPPPPAVAIRPETGLDAHGISAVHEAASPGEGTAELADRLRDGGYVLHSVVAACDGEIVGHAAFTRGFIDAETAIVTVGPVAVVPELQGSGVGTAMMEFGIARCVADGECAIFLLGDPGFYGRLGFTAEDAAAFTSPYAGPYFQAQVLRPGLLPPAGEISYPAPFGDLPS